MAGRSRGRPRAFDPAEALDRAMGCFWRDGFSATSLDELGTATGLARPSLYGAFGDKRDLYLAALNRYAAQSAAALDAILAQKVPVRTALARIFALALDTYRAGEPEARGCFLIGTAVGEAVRDATIREALAESLRAFDATLERLFAEARERDGPDARRAPRHSAMLAAAILHTLAVRSRAGLGRRELDRLVEDAIEAIAPA